jgi:hypothetical protein
MRQVCVTKMNESELSMKCRNESDDVKSVLCKLCAMSLAGVWGLAGRHPVCRQHERNTGSGMERGNLSSRCQGRSVKQRHCERERTNAGHRGRWLRSSDEVSVMDMERRESVVGTVFEVNREIGMSR